MNANASHGGLRTKRCLPAKFHQEPPHYDHCDLYSPEPSGQGRRPNPYPQVTANHSHCLKQRQLTLFYRLLPQTCRIRAKA
jgi:hypothetical protein